MKTENAVLEWDENDLPHSPRFEDVYYSQSGAREESEYVFITANNLLQRWQAQEPQNQNFIIGELGFGAGLNFLQVAQQWQKRHAQIGHLHYIAFEKYPISSPDLKRIHALWPELSELSARLRRLYTDHAAGCHRLQLSDHITLDLYYGDAHEQLGQRAGSAAPPIDCWFLDGFSPKHNPSLWQADLFQQLANNSREGSTLSTYSVAGDVRRQLTKVGFSVEKKPGYGRKRHMLVASFDSSPSSEHDDSSNKPWFTLPAKRTASALPVTDKQKTAIIIGAGLAGCSTAYSLARRGWQVNIFDTGAGVASGASGNDQLALRCRLFKKSSALAAFFLQGFLFSGRQFKDLTLAHKLNWHPCGVLQLMGALNQRQQFDRGNLEALYPEQVITAVSRAAASLLAGAELVDAGYYLPGAGWIEPHSLCQAYLSSEKINFKHSTTIDAIDAVDNGWQVIGTSKSGAKSSHRADVVVIANSNSAIQFEQTSNYPVTAVRGQSSNISATAESLSLQTVVCAERSIFPVQNTHAETPEKGQKTDQHSIAASYSNSVDATESRDEDDQENLRLAKSIFRSASYLSDDFSNSRVSWRCNASDQTPIVGMAADVGSMQIAFAKLGMNAKTVFTPEETHPPLYHPGLYLNIAHGSNGLASCPLSAEYLASLINRENLPISQSAMECLSPARFIIRDLKKQK